MFPRSNGRGPGPNVRWFNDMNLGGSRQPIFQNDSFSKLLQSLIIWYSFNLDPIGLWKFMLRIADQVLCVTGVRQDNEAFTLIVQPTSWVDIFNWDVIGQGRSLFRICKLTQNLIRFVEQDKVVHVRCNFTASWRVKNLQKFTHSKM